MRIGEYNKNIGKLLPAEKVGKYYYSFIFAPCPVLLKNKIYYNFCAINVETEIISKSVVYVPIEILILNKKDELLIKLSKYKNKLKKKLLKTQV